MRDSLGYRGLRGGPLFLRSCVFRVLEQVSETAEGSQRRVRLLIIGNVTVSSDFPSKFYRIEAESLLNVNIVCGLENFRYRWR